MNLHLKGKWRSQKKAENIDLKFRKQAKERDPQFGKILGDHILHCGT